MQIFDLHRPHETYQPAALFEKLGSVHRDQVFARPHRGGFGRQGPSPATSDRGMTAPQRPPDDGEETGLPTLLLKCLFFLVALGLVVTTPLGIWMGLTQTRRKPLAWILLSAGSVIPLVLLLV
jgi:hypothetical protein